MTTTDYSRKKGVECGTSGFGKKESSFFKIVTSPGVHRLRLPPEFTRRHGHNLPDLISLEVPNGLVWKVELIHDSNGEAWLQRGWHEFQEYYSLRFGHFLLFTYAGISQFEVNIFDTTATEIHYSHYDAGRKNQVAVTESSESDDDSVVFLKEKIFSGKKLVGIIREHDDDDIFVVDSNPPPKQSDGLRSEELRRSSRGKQNTSSFAKKESRFLDSSPNHGGDHIDIRVQQQPRDDNNRFKAYARASAFMSEKQTRNQFSIIVMPSSCVTTHKWPLRITAGFAQEILQNGKNSSWIVLVCEGKTWEVRCIRGSQRFSFSCGWRGFAEDNDLKAGDACVFEASQTNTLTWDVIIFRG
ncbi:B3 domain-containing transcription factor VRN1-like [Henckelia pumila]|uniref:B3 domain-containing transcription factor VRN1-like n=1 Tax=Henckelia pumila TaxID=405737 RepID=UPI003C6E1991